MSTKTSDRIKIMLRALNLSQKEFAEKVGLTEADVSRYLNGSRIPNAKHINQIADATRVNPFWIIGYGTDNQIVFLKERRPNFVSCQRLKTAMSEKGITTCQLAAITGINVGIIGRVYMGKLSLYEKYAVPIADVLDVDPEWLLGHKSDK